MFILWLKILRKFRHLVKNPKNGRKPKTKKQSKKNPDNFDNCLISNYMIKATHTTYKANQIKSKSFI
jgi:hypothetical protein